MTPNLEATPAKLYETDYVLWIETTLERLKKGDYAQVDWANLIEEIEYMSRKERLRLRSNLVIVLLHLLLHLVKWQYQPEQRSRSWKGSLVEHRRRVRESLELSPSLKPYLLEWFNEVYEDAIEQAAAEADLPCTLFPAVCPYAVEQVLDSKFLPE
jgi:hypothetical protein